MIVVRTATQPPRGGSARSRQKREAATFEHVRCRMCGGQGEKSEVFPDGTSLVERCLFCVDGVPKAVCGDCGEALPGCACIREWCAGWKAARTAVDVGAIVVTGETKT